MIFRGVYLNLQQFSVLVCSAGFGAAVATFIAIGFFLQEVNSTLQVDFLYIRPSKRASASLMTSISLSFINNQFC